MQQIKTQGNDREYHDFSSIVIQPKHYFYCRNGIVIKNPMELPNILRSIPDDEFAEHVDSGRNDFADWILKIYGHDILERLIRNILNKEVMIQTIEKYLREHFEEKPSNNYEFENEEEQKEDKNSSLNQSKNNQDDKNNSTDSGGDDNKKDMPNEPPKIGIDRIEKIRKQKLNETISSVENKNVNIESKSDELQKYFTNKFDELYEKTSDLRKKGFDTKVIELKLMQVGPKIRIFYITNSKNDAQYVKKLIEEITTDINELMQNNNVSVQKIAA